MADSPAIDRLPSKFIKLCENALFEQILLQEKLLLNLLSTFELLDRLREISREITSEVAFLLEKGLDVGLLDVRHLPLLVD